MLLCLCASPAAAQDTSLAKQYYRLGEEFYRRAAYAKALEQFKEAHKLAPKPAMLYNMGRCQEALGRLSEAIELFTRYLETVPPNRVYIEARITNLKKQLEARRAADRPKTDPSSQPAAMAPAQTAPPSQPAAAAVTAGAEKTGRPLRTAGWVLVGSGGALLVVGVVMGALASDRASEMEQIGQAFDTTYRDAGDVESEGKTFQTLQVVGLAAGGAALAAGVVLLVLDRRRATRERRAWLAPAMTPGGVLVSGGVTF